MSEIDIESILGGDTGPATIAAEFLDKFEREGWPTFERRGYSRDVAIHIWTLMHLRGDVGAVNMRMPTHITIVQVDPEEGDGHGEG